MPSKKTSNKKAKSQAKSAPKPKKTQVKPTPAKKSAKVKLSKGKKLTPKAKKKKAKAKRKAFYKKHKKIINRSIGFLVLISIMFFVYAYFQYNNIVNNFDKENQQPIKIYSSSLEVYAGQKISINHLKTYLQELGYVQKKQAISANTFGIHQQQITINNRAFNTAEQTINAHKIKITLNNGAVETLYSFNKKQNIAFVTLPPVKLTSLHTGVYTDFDPIAIKDVPQTFINTLLQIEDKRFYDHIGFDIYSIVRAFYSNVQAGRVVQGASTLTQQYVKTRYLTNERSLIRKIKELLISVVLEINFTKNQILQAYINSVFLGQKGNYRIRGFNLASHYFFGKSLQNINISEMASLVALVKAPSSYVIKTGNAKALKRRNLILNVLYENKKIDEKLLTIAKNYPLTAKQHQSGTSIFSSYIGLIKNELKQVNQSLSWTQNNRTLYTNMDINKQLALQKIVANNVTILEKNKHFAPNTLEAAAIIVDKSNGNILAAVANKNDKRFGWNRLLYMKRPIGSLIKPFVYYTALNQFGYSANSLINDAPVKLKIKNAVHWQPKNYDKKYHGEVTLTQALSQSYNLATVNLGLDIGVNSVIKTLKQAGYKKPLPNYASLFLGATEMTPLEITSLYLPLANGGFTSPLRTLSKATKKGQVNIANSFVSKAVLNYGTVAILSNMLKEAVSTGTARSLNWRLKQKPISVAGKTGTSNNLKDSWFIAYDKKYLVMVWLGRDDNKSSSYSGSSGALPIYADIKNYLDEN